MKTTFSVAGKLLIILLAAFAFQCSDVCTVTNTYYYMQPSYMSFEDLRSSVKSEQPKDLYNAGKIYFKDNFLYVNEVGKGIHVIDNRDPSNPVHKSFINIPGNVDLAIYGNTLYADSYVDLVAIDVSTPGQEHEIGRHKDMFTYYSQMHFAADPQKGIIVGMSAAEEVKMEECDANLNMWGWGIAEDAIVMSASSYSAVAKGPNNSVLPDNSAGIGGSMARFTITSDRLYALDYYMMKVIDVTNPLSIDVMNSVTVNSDIETIFPYGQNIFLGSRTGMYIYDITDADDPKRLSMFSHLRSCDPVVVEGKYAYVTLRTENSCVGNINQLQVIDISSLTSPKHISTYEMTNPHGLGIDNNVLFICDGSDGLKIYDATDKAKIDKNLKAHYKDIQTFDIIPFNNVAMMIAEDGLYQYNYSDLQNIRFLSKLEIKKIEK